MGSNEPAITPAPSRRGGAPSIAGQLGAFRFRRSASNRALVGVAGGIGERTGIDPAIVRAALLVLCLGGGLGLVLYCLAWAASSEPSPDAQPRLPVTDNELRQVFALGFIVLGVLLLARRAVGYDVSAQRAVTDARGRAGHGRDTGGRPASARLHQRPRRTP